VPAWLRPTGPESRLPVAVAILVAIALLSAGAAIYLTNIIVFGIWYWELDRGGPFNRAAGMDPHRGSLFPQMVSPELGPEHWEPRFLDYLYTSFTNVMAFSPTDTVPLSR